MNFRLVTGDWAALQPDAQAVRYDVFVIEQQIPVELEWDQMDAQCLHAVAYLLDDDDGAEQAVGTGRLLPDGHIGRMAVKQAARGTGLGGVILQALMDAAQQRGDQVVRLNAQTHAEPFYQRHGFVREGDEFIEAGIPHIQMQHSFG